ncbi:hypothetical protein NMY22_g18785 [Coprinellus aureogranulatus]|nr:hypothetical protein NMY22_g18785 [Coprinellus aureogranulatus]
MPILRPTPDDHYYHHELQVQRTVDVEARVPGVLYHSISPPLRSNARSRKARHAYVANHGIRDDTSSVYHDQRPTQKSQSLNSVGTPTRAQQVSDHPHEAASPRLRHPVLKTYTSTNSFGRCFSQQEIDAAQTSISSDSSMDTDSAFDPLSSAVSSILGHIPPVHTPPGVPTPYRRFPSSLAKKRF